MMPDFIPSAALNKFVFNETTVDMVLQDLMERGIKVAGGDRLGKTIIFAQNKRHAEFIMERFNKLYPQYHGSFAQRVICDDSYAQTIIDDFKQPEKEPYIAVSVDMMDTGIDVPECVNLVFFKKVRSKAKFWQMIGRGTRLCKELACVDQIDGVYTDKRRFLTFDYCGNLRFLEQHQSKATIISAVVHMDEKTPHMHLCFVPLTEDGRISAKDIMGNKKKLTWWQDEFWKHIVKKFPDLERGESASLTGRDYIPPCVFKEMTRLTRQKDKLEDLLTGINPFNAKSRAEEICKILDTYIPSVEKMDTLLRKYCVAFTKTASENKKLKTKNAELEESLASAQKVSTLKQIEDLKLWRDYDSAVAILEQIPAEVLSIYAQSSHRGKERPIEQSL